MGTGEPTLPYASLIEAAFDGLVVTRGLEIAYASPGFAAIVGCAASELVGTSIRERVAAESWAVLADLARDDEARRDLVVVRTDGGRCVVEAAARPCQLGGSAARVLAVRDVTAARGAVDDLAGSERRFRALIEQIPDLVAVHRGGTLIYANPALHRYVGSHGDLAVVGRSVVELTHPDDRPRVAARIRRMLESGAPEPAEVFRHVHADGTIGLVETSSVPIELDGTPAILAIARDVTDRIAVEQRLVEAELMASIGRLAAAVNHEINNPLSYLLLVQDQLGGDVQRLAGVRPTDGGYLDVLARLVAHLDELREGLARVATIAHDFKALTRVQAETLEAVDLRTVIPSAARIAGAEIRQRARLELALADVPAVRAHAGRLGQVVLNLLVNAAQAAPAAGDRAIRVSTGTAGDRVLIDIDDNGPGVAPEIAPRIFEPFFTTKATGHGTGLGLAICRSIVTSFGGTIELSRGDLGGARFRITLPVAG